MKKLAIGIFAVVALVGCGSTAADPCDAVSKCSADPAKTDADKKACKEAGKLPDGGTPKCNTEAQAFGSCATSKQVCGSDNKTDGVATLAACKTEYDAYTKCLTP